MLKLYELKRGDVFRIFEYEDDGPFKFDHIDGMYSVCYSTIRDDGITNIAAWTPVILESNDVATT